MALADDIITRHAACGVLDQRQICWLQEQGVPRAALHNPDVLARADVVFGPRYFAFNDEMPGELTMSAIIILAYDGEGVPADLVAWAPRSRQVATWLGRVAVMGDVGAPRLASHGALAVYTDPLGWLRAGREGVCIVDAALAHHHLQDVGPYAVEDADTGVFLEEILARPRPNILVVLKDAA